MESSPPAAKTESTEATWREIDQVIESIAKLAKSEESPGRFYAVLMEQIVSGLAALGGAVWTRDADGKLRQECLVNPPHPWICNDQPDVPRHGDLVRRVLESGEPRLVPPTTMRTWCPRPSADPEGAPPTANPTDVLLILFPWCVDQAPAGLIELFQRAGGGPQIEQGYLRFLEVIGEIVAEFHRNCQLRQFKQIAHDWAQFDQFARQVYASLDLRRTAFTIVNEGRRFLECDRVSLLVRRGRHYRLVAVSGVEKPNQRAELTRRMERLCGAAAKVGEPLWFPAANSDVAPELERLLSEYLDESHARSLVVVPLTHDPRPASGRPGAPPETAGHPVSRVEVAGPAMAILAVEKFFGTFAAREQAMVAEVSVHTTAAMKNCLELEGIPFLPILRSLGSWVKIRPLLKGALAAGLIAAIVAAALWLKADFNVVAEGELEPAHLRDVFARADGTVSDLCVEHGQHVHAGELLARLRRPQLDLEFEQVLGELQTAEKKLAALEAERLQVSRDSEDQRRRYGQATAQEEELHETIKSLKAQYEVLESKKSESEVRSPMEGEVLTWNVRQLLEDRPVSRGQILLTIGDLSGPWKLELRVPDRQAGHVLAAQETQPDEPLQVSYLLAMNPRQSFQGTLARLGMRSETAGSWSPGTPGSPDGPFLAATVDVDRSSLDPCTGHPVSRVGAGVRAYIQCGRRSLGYVWLHNLLDTIRTWFFF